MSSSNKRMPFRSPLVTPPNSSKREKKRPYAKEEEEENDNNGIRNDNSLDSDGVPAARRRLNNDLDLEEEETSAASRRTDNTAGNFRHPFEASSDNTIREVSNSSTSVVLLDNSDDDDSTEEESPRPSQQLTQPVSYEQDVAAKIQQDNKPPLIAILEDCHDSNNRQIEIRKSTITIGRSSECDIVVHNQSVSRTHCVLTFMEMDGTGTCYLSSKNSDCWVWEPKNDASHIGGGAGSWKLASKDNEAVPLHHHQRFRLLLPPPKDYRQANLEGIEYTLNLTAKATFEQINPGSHCFDTEYLKLLRYIELMGSLKTTNKKGHNLTLPQSFVLNIDLKDPEYPARDRNLLPLSSLRNMFGGRGALIEALWYLRGEDDITFLQKHKCHFWDKQATPEGWVGWNYGLLTNFPRPNGPPINQLENDVVQKLCKHGSSSRNMICSLVKPDEETVQGACTTSVAFSVSTLSSSSSGLEEALDLTINQRSSDVMVGLPHDVVVWSIILHLVRREVWIRSRRKLVAGKLSFIISNNAAHVYLINKDAFKEILHNRKPIENCQPHLVIDEDVQQLSMFDMAKHFEPTMLKVCDYVKFHPRIKLEQAL